MTKKLLEGHRELQFRVSLIRSTLLVDTAPSKENIEQLAHHILSEVDQLAHTEKKPQSSSAAKGDPMKLKSLEVEGGEKGKPKGREGQGEEPRCKFFLTESGCRRGKECTWAQDEKDGKRRCYMCLAQQSIWPQRAQGQRPLQMEAKRSRRGDQSPKASEETPKGGADPALKDLWDEASEMLKSLSSSSSTTSTKKEKPKDNNEDVMQRLQQQLSALKQKKFQMKRMAKGSTQGLLDSGATHPMRPPHPGEEIEGYQKVTIALADGTEVQLPMTSGRVMIGLDPQVEPIVPMGLNH